MKFHVFSTKFHWGGAYMSEAYHEKFDFETFSTSLWLFRCFSYHFPYHFEFRKWMSFLCFVSLFELREFFRKYSTKIFVFSEICFAAFNDSKLPFDFFAKLIYAKNANFEKSFYLFQPTIYKSVGNLCLIK